MSEQNAALFTSMADTFEALGRDEQALKAFIAKSPSTLDVGTESFRVQQPFLDDLTAFSKDFSGATHELRGALPPVNRAVEIGTPVQVRSVKLNDELRKTLGTVKDLAEAPGTNAALRGLTATVTTLNPQMRFYGPYVTVCNSWNYFFTYLAEHFSEPDTTGSAQRALVNTTGRQEDSLGSMGADEPANGKGVIEGTPQYGQDQPYGAAIGAGRERRLRGRPARLRRAPGALLPEAVQDHPRPALGRPAGPDLRRPRARARRARRSPPSRRPARTRRCRRRSSP